MKQLQPVTDKLLSLSIDVINSAAKTTNKVDWQAYEASKRQFEFGALEDACNAAAYPAMERLISQHGSKIDAITTALSTSVSALTTDYSTAKQALDTAYSEYDAAVAALEAIDYDKLEAQAAA